MYPLYTWGHRDLSTRLDALNDQGFHSEAAVASAQTLEQAFKRVIKQRMAETRQGFPKRGGLKLEPITTIKERDKSLKRLQGIEKIKEAWKKLVADGDRTKYLPKVFETTVGKGSWNVLRGVNNMVVSAPGSSHRNVQCRYGLLPLRHRLVHGTHSPGAEEIEVLARWGSHAAKSFLDPGSGISSEIGQNPFDRLTQFEDNP